jgi:hypothetical protein
MADPTLLIGDMPGQSLDFDTTLTAKKYQRLRHRRRYWGGHWELTFHLSDATMGAGVLDEYFQGWLMRQIGEYYGGQLTWRGVVWEMTRVKDGKRQRRSMSGVWNAVKCIYTTTTSTEQVETAYVTNADSISRYLRREQIIYKDNISSTQATAEATAYLDLTYEAWPISTSFSAGDEDGLEITCFGMGRLFNNLFSAVTTPAGLVEVAAFIDDIWGDLNFSLPFLGTGYIAANTLEVQREQNKPTRCGDLIDALARAGNGTVPFRWYVDSNLLFTFEPFSATPTIEWRGRSKGGIYKIGGDRVKWDAEPGVMVDQTAPSLPALPGDFLQQRNHELVEVFSMWQGQDAPQPETEEITEEQLLSDMESYRRMITDGEKPGYAGGR